MRTRERARTHTHKGSSSVGRDIKPRVEPAEGPHRAFTTCVREEKEEGISESSHHSSDQQASVSVRVSKTDSDSE